MAAVYRFSVRAEADLRDIAHYTLRTWGEEQSLEHGSHVIFYRHKRKAC
ncbi:MAG: hypothetical protein ABI693_35370 [Bryobacteraceae bacterium]